MFTIAGRLWGLKVDGLRAGQRSSLQVAAMKAGQLMLGCDFVIKWFNIFLKNQTSSLLVMLVLAQIQTPLMDFGLKSAPKPAKPAYLCDNQ